MKTLTKPVQSRLSSPRIYGYEEEGSRLDYWFTDSYGAHYFDCIQSEGSLTCNIDCLHIFYNDEETVTCG